MTPESNNTGNMARRARQWTTLAISVAVLVAVLIGYTRFLAFNEQRSGVVLADPVLPHIPAADLGTVTFVLIYGALLLALFSRLRNPRALALTVQAYTVLLLVRMAAMYTVPLAPPAGMLPLYDPLAGLGPGDQMLQDLFFSGHTATLFLLYLTASGRALRMLFLAATVAVGALVLVQHCHYTIDVLAAPFFAYGCYRATRLAHDRAWRTPADAAS
jgi:hypothetical protein